jgi:hypothetical protein
MTFKKFLWWCLYDNVCWLGCITTVNKNSTKVTVFPTVMIHRHPVCIMNTQIYWTFLYLRNSDESGSKNMYLNSCKKTVDSWKVKAQENIMIMFTNTNNWQYYYCIYWCQKLYVIGLAYVQDVVNNAPDLYDM